MELNNDQLYSLSTLSISLVLITSIIWYIKSFFIKKPSSPLPPGPRGLPIIGYLPFLGDNLVRQFTELGHKYGPVYKLQLGAKLCVVVSSKPLIKEVVRDKDTIFAHRDPQVGGLVATYNGNDIAWAKPDTQWRRMRKIFMHELLSSDNLKASFKLRRDVVRKTIRFVHTNLQTGEPMGIGDLIFRTELDLLMNLLWGGTIEGKEGERLEAEFRNAITDIIDLVGKPNISDFFPVLAFLDIQGVKRKMKGLHHFVDTIFDSAIAERGKKLSGGIITNEGRKDFLQILLELKETQGSEMSITQLKAMLMDIVVGGTDSSAMTIEWAISELLNHPEFMAKVQKELSDIIGTNNVVEEFHLPKLTYLQAVLKETMRLHPALPLMIPRCPPESATLGGFTVPKNTRVLINIYAVQRDPSIWENPTEFRPERFLDNVEQKSDFSGNNFGYLPFGSGRRLCAGLALAEIMLMYLLASLLHSYDWKLPEGETLDMTEKFKIILRKKKPLLAIPSPRLSDPKLYV
uniref:Cytochrome P450 706G22 n=1 Tax=Leucophyllum frutescens TaxID=86643 RepID=A0A7G6J4K5_LEUFR|nr:cytochrome P450 706G22 [Leucophyllum frutescens]